MVAHLLWAWADRSTRRRVAAVAGDDDAVVDRTEGNAYFIGELLAADGSAPTDHQGF